MILAEYVEYSYPSMGLMMPSLTRLPLFVLFSGSPRASTHDGTPWSRSTTATTTSAAATSSATTSSAAATTTSAQTATTSSAATTILSTASTLMDGWMD